MSQVSDTPDPNGIANEHILWAAGERQTPREVLDSVGITWTAFREPTWDDARLGLVSAWRRMHEPPKPSLWARLLNSFGLVLRAVGVLAAPGVAHG